jgi:2,5-diamino-6-(ribosylamino)-4(3H)-pyrimidinone 5'-phosphate reductase
MRPYVICHMMGTLDGRILADRWPLKNPSHYFEDQAAKIKADAWLVGRVTMQEFSSKRAHPKRKGTFRVPKTDFVGDPTAKSYAVAIDPSGKCRWDKNYTTTEHVIEVLTEKVSGEYLDHLRTKGVSYIFGGKKELDFDLVLRKLYRIFRIRRLRIDGGGHVNGSFLKAGLIDEFSLVLLPLADGHSDNKAVFEVSDDDPRRQATRFRLKSIKRIEKDFLWLRYEVVRKR